MSSDDPSRFYEDDEDPQKIFAKFDAGPKSVTTTPTEATVQIRWGLNYIKKRYGSLDLLTLWDRESGWYHLPPCLPPALS